MMNEPEQKLTVPKHQQLKPEHKPEQNLNVQVHGDGHAVYDPEEPGPFGWRPRSHLDRLPAETQAQILDVLETRSYRQAQAYISRPKTIGGMGIKTSVAALHAFFYRHRADELDEQREMLEEQTEHILAQAGENDEKFVQAAKHLFKRRLLETTVSPTSETAELRTFFGILNRIQNTELAERRVALAEQKQSAPKPTPEN